MKNSEIYRRPAEWEPHEATLLAWPANPMDWPGKFTPIHWVYTEIVRHVATHEPVLLIVQDAAHEKKVRGMLAKAHADLSQITFVQQQTDRGWMRDTSPEFVVRGEGATRERAAVQFKFTGWAKYDNWQRDAKVPARVAKELGVPLRAATLGKKPVVLEGGGIDGNGRGSLLTTEECFLDQQTQVRNPGFSKADYAEAFREHLGVSNVIWLGHGIAGDDTHGHVDDLCRFVNKNTIVLCQEPDGGDANHRPLAENWERLQSARLENGKRPEVVALPMPQPLVFDGTRVPASYANFYITNGSVLVPTFNDPKDREALGILAELFPGREVRGIHAVDLVWGFGTLHCLSHEIPA